MAVKGQQRCRADILEFRGVGRHEGPEALISERTPRQTERRRRKSEGQAEENQGIEKREEKDVSEGKSRMQGIPRSFRGQTERSKLLMRIKVNERRFFLGSRYVPASGASRSNETFGFSSGLSRANDKQPNTAEDEHTCGGTRSFR